MTSREERPSPPGDYGVVVVGSGPGGLQTAYYLERLGIGNAVISADDAPGGMFRRFPIFERLISWTQPEAPVEPTSRAYEAYDQNSLVADEPHLRGLVREQMARDLDVPAREEMEAGLEEFAERAAIRVRYGCRWESTRLDGSAIVVGTSDGEYRCRAVVFAVGVTEPWRPAVPGIEDVPHYVDTQPARAYRDRRVLIIGKRNSGFEVANALVSEASRIVVVSPRPMQTAVLARLAVRARYLHPYDEYVRGSAGRSVLNASIERIERTSGGFHVHVVPTGLGASGPLVLEADDVIAATGFRTALRDLPGLGVETVSEGRLPALTPFWESISVPGIFFAGNVTQAASGLRKHGVASNSSMVCGFRYNARILARHLAETRFGHQPERPKLEPSAVVPFLLDELARAPELWTQKGYLARVLTSGLEGVRDEGFLPLEHVVDADGSDCVAVTVEYDPGGSIVPVVYLRQGGRVSEHTLPPHPVHAFDGPAYRDALVSLLQPLFTSN